jgi:hypothetical protein
MSPPGEECGTADSRSEFARLSSRRLKHGRLSFERMVSPNKGAWSGLSQLPRTHARASTEVEAQGFSILGRQKSEPSFGYCHARHASGVAHHLVVSHVTSSDYPRAAVPSRDSGGVKEVPQIRARDDPALLSSTLMRYDMAWIRLIFLAAPSTAEAL